MEVSEVIENQRIEVINSDDDIEGDSIKARIASCILMLTKLKLEFWSFGIRDYQRFNRTIAVKFHQNEPGKISYEFEFLIVKETPPGEFNYEKRFEYINSQEYEFISIDDTVEKVKEWMEKMRSTEYYQTIIRRKKSKKSGATDKEYNRRIECILKESK